MEFKSMEYEKIVRSTEYGGMSTEYGGMSTEYGGMSTAPYFVLRTELRVLIVLRATKQLGTRLAGCALVHFPNLIGPIRRFAEMFGPGTGLDHGTDKTDRHLANLRPFLK